MSKFDVISIDWPWSFEVYNKDSGEGRSAAAHYDTDSLTWNDWRIFIRYIWPLMADNCALCLWMVRPSQDMGMTGAAGWNEQISLLTGRAKRGTAGAEPMTKDSVRYKTELFTLVKKYRSGKPFVGMGYFSRGNTEPCMLYVRGSMPREDKGVQQVIEYVPHDIPKAMRHSYKPPEYRRRIERLWPNRRYLEIFARQDCREPGWTYLGNEIDGKDIRKALTDLRDGVVKLKRAA